MAVKAKEMDGMTQGIYVEGKETEVRHEGTDRIQNMKETEKLPFREEREPAKFHHSTQYTVFLVHRRDSKINYQMNLANIVLLHSKHGASIENTGMTPPGPNRPFEGTNHE